VLRFLVGVLAWFVAAAVGLLVANLVLDGMQMDASSYFEAVILFAILQGVLSPLILRTARNRAPALLGAAGLVTSFVALLVTDLISSGLTITGVSTWVFATAILWVACMVASYLLPLILLRRAVAGSRERRGR
jgi:Mycobacterial 4 TMS phage holin, superfamily IV